MTVTDPDPDVILDAADWSARVTALSDLRLARAVLDAAARRQFTIRQSSPQMRRLGRQITALEARVHRLQVVAEASRVKTVDELQTARRAGHEYRQMRAALDAGRIARRYLDRQVQLADARAENRGPEGALTRG